MCGVIGIISDEPVVNDILIGMMALQHRGQDAAGLAVFDDIDFYFKKKKGAVSTLLDEDTSEVKGLVGVGHTRYPTAGTCAECDAHPFLVDSTKKMALVQNGNLTNYIEMKDKLRKKGVFLDSNSDGELLSKILAHEFEISGNPFQSVEKVMNKISGSYSIVVAIQEHGILAFRDPNGFRPLIIGKKGNSYCITSESVVFNALGYEIVRDVMPGEVVFIDKNLNFVSQVVKNKKKSHCMFEWVYFARPDSLIDKRSVYNARLKLGKLLAEKWDKEIDVVVPVPDTARAAAIKFAEELKVPYREGLIKNRYLGRIFIMSTQKKREFAVNLKLSPIIASINKKRVALFDDSIVRGTTAKRIVTLLRNAGAKEVHFISTCPPIKFPCHYGIDMPTKSELIAASKSVEDIRKEIGADSLTYQPLESLYSACKNEDLCVACLNGCYPTEISKEQMEVMAESRIVERKD